eukprot:jgi/Mesvir1/22789/Mv14177-RA.1
MERLEEILSQFLVTDNEARRQAEEVLRQLAKEPAIVPALLDRVQNSGSDMIRHLAAVLLRKKISGHWIKLTDELRNSAKTILLESIVKERCHPVRRACADVVSVIAKHTLPLGQWHELMPFLLEASRSPQEGHREVALVLFNSLTETIVEHLRPHFATLLGIFLQGLKDHSVPVRVAALKAAGTVVTWITDEKEVVLFRELVPAMMDVARAALASGDDDPAILTFEIFDDLVENPLPMLMQAMPAIVAFASEVASNAEYSLSVRYQASQLLAWLARYKPKMLTKQKLVVPLLETVCRLACEAPPPDLFEDDVPPHRFAIQVLDMLAVYVPAKHVFPLVAAFAASNIESADANCRAAAVVVLGVVSQGCAEQACEHIADILPAVLKRVADDCKEVKAAACFAIGEFAEHLQPEVLEYYQECLSAIFHALQDPEPFVQEKAIYALDSFCDHLDADVISPFLAPFSSRLLELLCVPGQKKDVQCIALTAIGSAASAAGKDFLPYAEPCLRAITPFLSRTADEELQVRAHATECVSLIAVAVGADIMRPHLRGFVDAALAGFNLDYTELREYTHSFFANVAECLGAEFAEYLPVAVKHAFASCNINDGEVFSFRNDNAEGDGTGGTHAMGGAVSSDEDEEGLEGTSLSIRTGVLDEKSAALQALGSYARHCKAAFMPYMEEMLAILKRNVDYFHEDVRQQTMEAYHCVVIAVMEAYPSGGLQMPLRPEVKHVADIAMETFVKAMVDDDDKEVVAQACISAGEVMKLLGTPAAIEPYLKGVSESLESILTEKALCQEAESDSEDEEGEDADHDAVLMDAACELLPSMATVLKEQFVPLLQHHFNNLMRYAKPSRTSADRTMVVACFAEVVRAMGPSVAPFADAIFPLAMKELSQPESSNRRNAAFCLGVLCEQCPDHAAKLCPQLLQKLHPLFFSSEEGGVRDNAVSAVCRMMMACPQQIPLAQVLPVLLDALPLEDDKDEALPVYGCLCHLLTAFHPDILPHVPKIVQLFGGVAVDEDVGADTKSAIGQAFKRVMDTAHRAELEALVVALPEDQKAALVALVSQTQ